MLTEEEKKNKKRAYVRAHKEIYADRALQYFRRNRETVLLKNKIIKTCQICNKDMTKSVWARHTRSKKHQKLELEANDLLVNAPINELPNIEEDDLIIPNYPDDHQEIKLE